MTHQEERVAAEAACVPCIAGGAGSVMQSKAPVECRHPRQGHQQGGWGDGRMVCQRGGHTNAAGHA